jgi:phage terminase large subunit-like protein
MFAALLIVLMIFAVIGSAQVPQAGHVVLVVEENHSYGQVIGNSSMPYLNSLANKYGLAVNYYGNTHPSIGNYFMLGDALYPPGHPEQSVFEIGPEINIVAVDRQQGARVREDIADMALSVPAFTERLIVKNSYIKNRKRGGKVVVFSKDINNKDGGRPSLVITEEWHAHTTTDIHEVAVSGKGKKAQCLELIITTAGKDAEVKPCYKDDQQYKQVLSGDIRQDDVFVMIREIDDEDDPHDEACWCKANPFIRNDSEYAKNLLDEIRTQHRDAYAANNATKIREWLRTRMNRWQADSETRYMSTEQMAMWDKLAITPSEFTKLTVGVPCTLGADLSKKIDLTATGNVYALPDGRFAIDAHGYMPEAGVMAHEHSDRVPYRLGARRMGYRDTRQRHGLPRDSRRHKEL